VILAIVGRPIPDTAVLGREIPAGPDRVVPIGISRDQRFFPLSLTPPSLP